MPCPLTKFVEAVMAVVIATAAVAVASQEVAVMAVFLLSQLHNLQGYQSDSCPPSSELHPQSVPPPQMLMWHLYLWENV